MKLFQIYRASAGSGKTYTLVHTYLSMALQHPQRFRRILAVTFTNKSTHSLKHRILNTLHDLAQGEKGGMAQLLAETKGWSFEQLQQRAQEVLGQILHHYSYFSVTTIDSFFQTVVRAFTKELGLHQGFSLELDQAYVLQVLIQRIMEDTQQNPQLLQWLVAFSERKILEGKHWDIQKELLSIGQALLSEPMRAQEEALLEALAKQPLSHLLQTLWGVIQQFEQGFYRFGAEAIKIIETAHYTVQDFAYGQRGVAGYLYGLQQKKKFEPTQRVWQAYHDPKAWCPKKSPNAMDIEALVINHLQPLLKKNIDYYSQHHRHYYTAKAATRLLYALGIHTSLLEKLTVYRQEHATMLLADATILLQRIIKDNDAPFVYEKIGSFYHHFLIDEFQDVSSVQWRNLRPLIQNALSEGHHSAIVGDAKQAIYRWRGGDASLLLAQVSKDVGEVHTERRFLAHNWRSRPAIVQFNNIFFEEAAQRVRQALLQEIDNVEEENLRIELQSSIQTLFTAYENAQQVSSATDDGPGYVQVTFRESEEPNQRLEAVIAQIEQLQQDGFRPQDIALLVRNNQEIEFITQALLRHQQGPHAKPGCRYEAAAASSLSLAQAPCVRLLLSALRCLEPTPRALDLATLLHTYQTYLSPEAATNPHLYFAAASCPDDTAWHAYLPAEFVTHYAQLRSLPLYTLLSTLSHLFSLDRGADTAFLQAFKEIALRFEGQQSRDYRHFVQWWEERGYQTTLPILAEQDAIRVMTVHQAKGLEFKAVILPFCQWNLDHPPQKPPILWCDSPPPGSPYPPLLPLYYSTSLKDTLYERQYYEEKIQAYFDSLNLLYVALTRAETQLYILADLPKKEQELGDVGALLYRVIAPYGKALSKEGLLQQGWDASANTFRWGKNEGHTVSKITLSSEKCMPMGPSINYLTKQPSLRASLLQMQKTHYGNMAHLILAQVYDTNHLENALRALQAKGLINYAELDRLRVQIMRLWEHAQVRSWFDGTWKVKTEATILLPSGRAVRPDRIMIRNKKTSLHPSISPLGQTSLFDFLPTSPLEQNEIVVIDFKTGQKHSQHVQQVRQYLQVLQQLGYVQPKGYLLYVENSEVISCTDAGNI